MTDFFKRSIVVLTMLLFSFKVSYSEGSLYQQTIELSAVVEYFSKRWNKIIIPNDGLLNTLKNRKATIIIPPNFHEVEQTPEYWRLIYNQILSIYNYTLIEKGDIYRLVPINDTKKMSLPLYKTLEGRDIDGTSEKIVTQIVILKHISVDQIRGLFRYISRLMPPLQLQDKKTLIVTATESDLKYFLDLLSVFDVESDKPAVKVYQLERASASKVKGHVREYLNVEKSRRKGAVNPAAQPFFIEDETSNRLFVSATDDHHIVIQRIIDFLDAPIKAENQFNSIEVYRLKNSDAEQVSKKLGEVLKARSSTKKKKGALPEDIPTIVPFEAQNSLIISAQRKETFDAVKKVIQILDVRKKQVLISSTIIEVQHSADFNFGTDFGALADPSKGKAGLIAGSSLGIGIPTVDLSNVENPVTYTPDTGQTGLHLALPYGRYDVIPFVLRAAKSNNELNVLARPSLTCNDNEKASLKITEERAYSTSTVGSGGQQTNAFGGFHEAGIILNITPTISSENFLKLQIEQNVDRFIPSASGRDIRNKREVNVTVTVPNKTSVVIGGLTQQQHTNDQSKLPVIENIPLLGKLFQSKSNSKSKSTLYFFITPEIISSFDQLTEKSDNFHDDLEEQVSEQMKENTIYQNAHNEKSKRNAELEKSEAFLLKLNETFNKENLKRWIKKGQYLNFALSLMKHRNEVHDELLPNHTQEFFDKEQLDASFFSALDMGKTELDKLSAKARHEYIGRFNHHLMTQLDLLSNPPKKYHHKRQSKKGSAGNTERSKLLEVPLFKSK